MVGSLLATTRHLTLLMFLLSSVASASPKSFPDLIGQIVSSFSYRSLAIFKSGERVYAKHIGERVNGFWITAINYRHVYLQDDKGRTLHLMVGNNPDMKDVKRPVPGLEVMPDRIIMTEQFRNYIAEENLLTIMFQAASEPFYNDEFETIGYQLFEIEPDSIYDLIGIKNYDIITHIDGVSLDSPWTAISMLKGVKKQRTFSFTYLRNGVKTIVDVNVTH
jgi:type II secretory pathway component PulC